MTEFQVDLNRVEDVKNFVRCAGKYDVHILAHNQERTYTVDACSIMAIFTLDLSKPVIVEIKDSEVAELFKNDIQSMLV